MITLFVYNQADSRVEIHPSDGELPYVNNSRLTAQQLTGKELTAVAWTDKRLLEAYDALCGLWGGPIRVNHAFCRFRSGMHKAQSAHYAGLAMDLGRGMNISDLNRLRVLAVKSGDWSYVEPAHIAPTWVHVELQPGKKRYSYPSLSAGDSSAYCFVLQDALKAMGYDLAFTGSIDAATLRALKKFQHEFNIPVSGRADRITWRALFQTR
ncbi:MAG: putative peptidoglycan binding domain protein [Firmicutes bacterium ADurb.Bin182]|nr:MAG: putative peptidoglycan binding domain protein [Firmicutes bacterium ADurb.Bin182]